MEKDINYFYNMLTDNYKNKAKNLVNSINLDKINFNSLSLKPLLQTVFGEAFFCALYGAFMLADNSSDLDDIVYKCLEFYDDCKAINKGEKIDSWSQESIYFICDFWRLLRHFEFYNY